MFLGIKLAMELKSQDDWKKHFGSANASIYDIIENAITVAASDDSEEFILRGATIAQKIYTCTLSKRCCSDRGNCNDDEQTSHKPNNEERVSVHEVSKYGRGEVETLTDAIDEQHANIDEVKRIKDSLENSQHQVSPLDASSILLRKGVFSSSNNIILRT